LDTQDREYDNRHRAGPENLSNLCGMWKSGGVAVALGGGLALISHSPKCLSIFLMISGYSMKLKRFVFSEHLEQQRGSVSQIF